MEYLYKDQTHQIIGAAQEVHKELGSGFVEIIYQDALEIEFQNRNIVFKKECPLSIYYKEKKLNRTFYIDFLCFDKIIVETKATKNLIDEFYSQVIHYLKATQFKLGLLINFGQSSLNVKRIIL